MSRVSLFVCFAFWGLCGCQSDPLREFGELRQGMDKSEVLDIAGNPNRTQRWRGMDRWTYIYFVQSDEQGWRGTHRTEKEVHFSDGHAVYIGDHQKPDISAEEQDRLNEASNLALEREATERREANRSEVRTYHRELDDDEEVRYIPHYEPVD